MIKKGGNIMIGMWIGVGVVCILIMLAGIWGFYTASENDSWVGRIIAVVVTAALIAGVIIGNIWFLNNTATGARYRKEWQSEIDNGLKREITITAEDGREIFHYEGKVDIETKHDGNSNYILFESEEGQRYIIYYGITDTIIIIEKAE